MRFKHCEHCQQWTNGDKHRCNYCGMVIDAQYKQEIQTREEKDGFKLRLVTIHTSDAWYKVLFKRLVQGAQIIYFVFS